MTPLRLAVSCLVAALALPVVPATADAGSLTITGSRAASAVLTVRRTVTYDVDRSTVALGDASYAGFAIGRDFARVWTKHDRRANPPIEGRSVTGGTLRPGTYRVYLFTDGSDEVSVTVPWSADAVTLRPARPVDATVGLDQTVVTNPLEATLTLAQDGASRDNVSAGAMFESVVSPVVDLTLCLTASGATCEDARVLTTYTGGGSALNGWGAGFSAYGDRRPTRGHDVRAEVNGVSAGVLTVVTLRFTPQPIR